MQFLFYAFIVIVSIQLIYYVFVFGRFSFSKTTQKKQTNIPVSVLICARNEAENLKQFLSKFANQNYSNYELVLINDGSYDDTLEIMKVFKEENQKCNIKIVDVIENEQFWGNKKYALTLGIKASTHEYLLFTDADCQPNSEHWIYEMVSHFTEKKRIVLGYGAYRKIKHSLLNKLIRFETLMTAIQYFSYAKTGLPYMGVGRNLAYTKSQFFNANGFAKHMHLKSGDDDLFINQIANNQNVNVCYSESSFTISEPKKTFKNWILQKRRHVSTASHYKTIHKLLLGLFYSSQLLFWIMTILLFSLQYEWKIVLGIVLFRFLFQYVIVYKSAKKLNETDVVFLMPFLEIFLILIQLFIFIKNLFSKPTHW